MSPTLADLVSGHDPVQALEEQQRPGSWPAPPSFYGPWHQIPDP
jgi:hypothetical protein